MRKAALLFTLGLAGSAYCLDEYLPIEAGKFEGDIGYGFLYSTSTYDNDGKKQDIPGDGSITGHNIPLQIKYGIMPGLEVSVGWAFTAVTTKSDLGILGKVDDTQSGLGQPDIAVKYALMDLGLGVFGDFTAPFATGDFADPDQPPMAIGFGALFTKTFMPNFRLTSTAGYKINFEGENKVKDGNEILLLAKPEFVINPFAGVYLGLREDINSESETDGTGNKDDGHLFTLAPGWNALWLPNVATEVNVPITLFGKNNIAAWGINANVYVTLP
jgi:hypothetical protein